MELVLIYRQTIFPFNSPSWPHTSHTPQHLCNQRVALVLTAHPTQALRASLLKKYAPVRKELDKLHNKRLSPYEKVRV